MRRGHSVGMVWKRIRNMNIFKFKPLLKQTIWGGDKIIPFKGVDEKLDAVGESWEISGVPGKETVVLGGPHDGMTMSELMTEMKDKLVGKAAYERYGNEFPLLIKFIDARQDLSIQVHPTDEIAKRQGKECGKTEMWYIMESDADAKLYSGLKMRLTPDEYKDMVEKDTICDALAQYNVSEGDVFFLPAGRIHSIGSGCFLAEIQQTSDVTYRIYDFKRKDKNGNYRELHTAEAAESIDYTVSDDYRTHYNKVKNTRNTVVECGYFTTSIYDVEATAEAPVKLDYAALDGFVVLICVKGEGKITDSKGESMPLCAGDTLLIPATETCFEVSGALRLLETH